MSLITVMTTLYGGIDELREPPLQDGVEDVQWLCITDDPSLDSETWGIVVEPHEGVDPRLAGKFSKMRPWEYAPYQDVIVRFDSAAFLARPDSLAWLLDAAPDAPLSQFVHPARDCIYDEVEAASTQAKYAGQPMREQVESYRQGGHPAHWGLWETGVQVWRMDLAEPLLQAFGNAWLNEVHEWSLQDQLCQPPLLRRFGLWPGTLPGSYWDNPMVGRQRHLIEAAN